MIETPRLRLRPHVLDDFEPWLAMFADPAVVRFLAVGALSREEGWNRLLRYAGHWSLLGYGLFAVLDKPTGRFLGDVGFADFHRGLGERFDGVPEATWIFTGAAQGQGYASEAVAAAHRWLDASRPGERRVAIVNPDNRASLRVAQKNGYAPFGRCLYKGAPYATLERAPAALS